MKNAVQIDFQMLDTGVLPKAISEMTGIVPDTELVAGERNKKLNLPRQNIWSIRSCADSDNVAEHWRSLEIVLGGVREILGQVAATGVAKFTLIVNSDQRIPPLTIPPSMSEFAGFLNAAIDIDHLQP
jgi:hypothetical protein